MAYSSEFKTIAIALAEKTSTAQASRELGVPPQTLTTWKKQAQPMPRVKVRRYSMAFRRDAIALAQRTSAEFACEKLGISAQTLTRWQQSRAVPRRTSGYSPEEKAEVIAWAKETSIRNAAEEYSIPAITVRRWLNPPPPEIVRKAHRRYNASALGKERKRRYRERIKSAES